jgi:carboxymethylenebutenolidase
LTLTTESVRCFDAYLSRPLKTRAPAIVVLHDMFGLNESIRTVAVRYASLGYVAMVPNLFWRSANPDPIPYDEARHPAAWERLKALDLGTVTADMRTAVNWLREQSFTNGKVAALGFCGGGRFAFLAAARCNVDAAAALYGLGISEHLGELDNVKCPLQLHYGLKDQHIPRQEIDAVSAGVRGRPSIEVFLYPEAGHSFANPVRPTFEFAAAKLAAARIDAMLERTDGQ